MAKALADFVESPKKVMADSEALAKNAGKRGEKLKAIGIKWFIRGWLTSWNGSGRAISEEYPTSVWQRSEKVGIHTQCHFEGDLSISVSGYSF